MKSRRKKNFLYFGLSTGIIAALIYFADIGKFQASINSAKTPELILGIVFGILTFAVFGFTWHRFLGKISVDSSYSNSLKLFMAGQFMNSVTPLGQAGGEPVMAYIVKDNQKTSYQKALSAVVSADIVNTIPYITFLLTGTTYLFLFGDLNQTITQTALATTGITIIGAIAVYILWFEAEKLEKIFKKLAKTISKYTDSEILLNIEEKIEELIESFQKIGEDPKHLTTTILVAHLSFASQVIALFFIMASVDQAVGLTSMYFIIAIASLANFSPTPGGSGTYEAAMAGILTVFTQINFAEALTIAILYRVATYWSGLILGYLSIISLRRTSGLSIERIREKAENRQENDSNYKK